MKQAARAVLWFAATGLSLAAAEADEPLAGVKQELKQLQTDSTAQKSGVAEPKLKGATPPIVLQPQAPLSSESLSSNRKSAKDQKDLKRQQDAEKNWLVREYEKLETKSDAERRDDKIKLPEASFEEKSEHELLQDRLSANDPKSRAGRDDSHRPPRADAPKAPDPFAPFMKDWLANSPSSGPALDALNKAGSNQPAGPGMSPGIEARPLDLPGSTASSLFDSSASDPRRDRNVSTMPANNPFLSGLELPGQLENAPAAASRSPVADALAPAMMPSAQSPLTLQNEAIAPSKRNTVTPPTSKQAEDKKYFPQQKRF